MFPACATLYQNRRAAPAAASTAFARRTRLTRLPSTRRTKTFSAPSSDRDSPQASWPDKSRPASTTAGPAASTATSASAVKTRPGAHRTPATDENSIVDVAPDAFSFVPSSADSPVDLYPFVPALLGNRPGRAQLSLGGLLLEDDSQMMPCAIVEGRVRRVDDSVGRGAHVRRADRIRIGTVGAHALGQVLRGRTNKHAPQPRLPLQEIPPAQVAGRRPTLLHSEEELERKSIRRRQRARR